MLLTAVGMGAFAGLAEVAWTYLLPLLSDQWRTVLPHAWGGLGRFVAAAVAVDAAAGLVCGALLAGVAWLAGRLAGGRRAGSALRTLVRAGVIGAGLSYLYVGWIALFVLLPADRGTLTYRLILGVGVAVLVLAGLAISGLITWLARRWRRAGAGVWVGACAVALLLIVPGFVQYRGGQSVVPVRATLAAGAPRPNVLLVTLDTLRADYVGCYGHPWIETPTLDALAGDGVLFEQAIAQAPSTTPSHCTLMTGTYPFEHAAHNGKPMRSGLVTLADALAANGYETVAFTSATTTRSINSGLQQGFERYVDSLVPWSELLSADEFQHLIAFYLLGIAQHSQISGAVVSDRAIRWLERRDDDRPFFAWLHYFDPHDPYGSPPPFRDRYRGRVTDGRPHAGERERYAEDVSFADHQLGRVVQALRARGLYERTLIIATADHGEAFGEWHGDVQEFKHGRYLYDTTQHVPLIIKDAPWPASGESGSALRQAADAEVAGAVADPEGQSAGAGPRRIPQQVELADVAPTVLALLGIEPPSSFVGAPLDALVRGEASGYPARDALAFNVIDVPSADVPGGLAFVQQLAVRSPAWKYITIPRTGRVELYDLAHDRHERVNVATEHPDVAAERAAVVLKHWDARRDVNEDPRHRIAPALVRELQALGYAGGGAEPEADGDE